MLRRLFVSLPGSARGARPFRPAAAALALMIAIAGVGSARAAALPPEPFGFSWTLTVEAARERFARDLVGEQCTSAGEKLTLRTAPSPLGLAGSYVLRFNSRGLLRSVEFVAESNDRRSLGRDAERLRGLLEVEYGPPSWNGAWNVDGGVIYLSYRPGHFGVPGGAFLSLEFVSHAAAEADIAVSYACPGTKTNGAGSPWRSSAAAPVPLRTPMGIAARGLPALAGGSSPSTHAPRRGRRTRIARGKRAPKRTARTRRRFSGSDNRRRRP